MVKRFVRTITVLVALVVAYQAYVLLAVPFMEPSIKAREARATTEAERERGDHAVTQYQLLLANYFPKDHWSQTRPPKVFASSGGQAMLVLDDYTRHAEAREGDERYTQVDIARFALLVFPTPAREGITPPRDVIVLEAPNGARLRFDDFRPELGRIGQIMGGHFPGRITIRSDMHEEGPADDLLVETAELEMNTKLLYSQAPVRFRLGKNVGGGRELEIRFLADEHVQPKEGLKIAGIDSLEIRRDVRMRLHLETNSLLPGGEVNDSTVEPSPGPAQKGSGPKADPVEVTCSGPFTFDFVRYVASLDRDVDLRMIHPNGPSDQLFCKHLDLHFAPKETPGVGTPAIAVDASERQQRDLGRLEPVAIVAQGHPVVVNSPSKNAQARGDRVQIALREQRVRVAGAREATLVYGLNVLRAPVIDYQHPPKEASSPIGRFRATGPGTLQYVPDPAKPDQVFQAAWQTLVDLSREKGQPVLTLDGRPQFALGAAGALTADQMKVYLRELQGNVPTKVGLPVKASTNDGAQIQVTPDRILARGNVEIRSPRLTGRTGDLLVTFHMPAVVAPSPAGSTASAGGQGTPPPAAVTPAPATPNFASQLMNGGGTDASGQVFQIVSDTMRLDAQLLGQTVAPTTLECNGNVMFHEVLPPGTPEQPMAIRGQRLTVDRIDTAPYVTIRGANAAGVVAANGDNGLAQIAGRGVTMFVNTVEIDVHENRLWSDGAGKATLLVTRGLDGNASATPFPLDLSWSGRLNFDGSTIAFERDVVAAGTDDTLRCDRLGARLNSQIVFGEAVDQKAIDVTEITCDGRVALNHVTRDATGLVSHERAQLSKLTINQQTGAIFGKGPGEIRSTRFGDSLTALAGIQNSAQPQIATAPGAGSKLNFLRVKFDDRMTGNMTLREITFFERVRAVYGPVDAWEQELDFNRPESLLTDALTLTCNEMRINEDPVAMQSAGGRRPGDPVLFQFRATGNVQIDGQVPTHGPFTARAEVATYERAKDAFTLEGTPRSPATLLRAGQTGAPPAADWIRFTPSANNGKGSVEVQGIKYLEITPEDLKKAQRPENVK